MPLFDEGMLGYYLAMTKLLAEALEAVTRLSPESQDEIARAMLHLAGADRECEDIPAAHLVAVLEGLAQAKAGQFAPVEAVEAALRRFES